VVWIFRTKFCLDDGLRFGAVVLEGFLAVGFGFEVVTPDNPSAEKMKKVYS